MDATLDAKKRDGRGKNEARRLRAGGRIPAVVYGARTEGQLPEGVPVAVDPKEVLRILHSESGANTLINLKLDGGESRVMVRDYQLDPITHQLLHADFYQLAMDKAIIVSARTIERYDVFFQALAKRGRVRVSSHDAGFVLRVRA